MDIKDLRAEVFQKTGISIDADDPFFAAMVMLDAIGQRIEKGNKETLEKALVMARAQANANDKSRQVTEATLADSEKKLAEAIAKVSGVHDGMRDSAAITTRNLLSGDGGVIQTLELLVREEKEALEWLNKAVNRISNEYWVSVSLMLICALVGGFLGALVAVKFFT